MVVVVRVERVTLDTSSNRFVVILRDDTYNRWLPIVVGPAEAQAIALQLEKVSPPRPMTHDLMKTLLESVKVNIDRVVVSDLKENTYYATIDVKQNGFNRKIDARPSDAIALALRTSSPIYVDEKVMKKAALSDDTDQLETVEKEEKIDVMSDLDNELKRAVKQERYEDAARIRDEIIKLQNKSKGKKRKK
jgi:bifunctional DNase/RNase